MKKLSLLILSLILLTACAQVPPDLSFATKVTIDFANWNENDIRAEGKTVESTETSEVKYLIDLLTSSVKRDSGNCGFYTYRLTFSGNGKEMVLLLSGDSDDIVNIGAVESADNMYSMSNDNRKLLSEFLEKYSIPMEYIGKE